MSKRDPLDFEIYSPEESDGGPDWPSRLGMIIWGLLIFVLIWGLFVLARLAFGWSPS